MAPWDFGVWKVKSRNVTRHVEIDGWWIRLVWWSEGAAMNKHGEDHPNLMWINVGSGGWGSSQFNVVDNVGLFMEHGNGKCPKACGLAYWARGRIQDIVKSFLCLDSPPFFVGGIQVGEMLIYFDMTEVDEMMWSKDIEIHVLTWYHVLKRLMHALSNKDTHQYDASHGAKIA